jgi:phosphoribosyl 1,2-cyclic phosphate phosphodiesterase
MELTFLGTGTSQGVPVIACDCDICMSQDSKDKRLRSSAMITIQGKNYVIDSGPDFRQQMLRENVQDLRAILFTHEHKDHIAGMDDVRAFNFKHQRDMDVYCDNNVQKALLREYP